MCELLGMSFNKPAPPGFFLDTFWKHSKVHSDGWGLAFYQDKAAQVIKEPIKALSSGLASYLATYSAMRSNLFLAHIRHSSGTAHIYKNTHPFHRELEGKDYVFAHNGILKDYSFSFASTKPIGETDSESAFCYLLGKISKRKINKWSKNDFQWLLAELKKVNSYGIFNCLFSDGEYLFCYRGRPDRRQKKPDRDLNYLRYTNGVIVATKSLTKGTWIPFLHGQLMIFKSGKVVFSTY